MTTSSININSKFLAGHKIQITHGNGPQAGKILWLVAHFDVLAAVFACLAAKLDVLAVIFALLAAKLDSLAAIFA
ncbi:hypothetical protein [Lysinibacillus sp. fls2-241-R2A-57]|uniref:hypothetical protein n=1 Tax=Lysinibacillus sp. fls2-241-R2A-57 TaxID=3040292 RepID=UPI002554A709|nr:hypothetical protein [Lysinibacillus sp. fls2-241-R2A-57]